MYRLLSGLYTRLRATNRTQALLRAQELGLLDGTDADPPPEGAAERGAGRAGAGPDRVDRRGHDDDRGRRRRSPERGPGGPGAEARGFEPRMGLKAQTALAVRRHRPD